MRNSGRIASFCLAFVLMFSLSAVNVSANWETLVYVDEMPLLTRAGWSGDGELSLMLRSLMEFMGYRVEWDENIRRITLGKEEETIHVYVDTDTCFKNGEAVQPGPGSYVFILFDRAYVTQSFLKNVFNIEVVSKDVMDGSNRINGVSFSTGLIPFEQIAAETITKIEAEEDNPATGKIYLGNPNDPIILTISEDTLFYDVVYGEKAKFSDLRVGLPVVSHHGGFLTGENDFRTAEALKVVKDLKQGEVEGKIAGMEENSITIQGDSGAYLVFDSKDAVYWDENGKNVDRDALREGMAVKGIISPEYGIAYTYEDFYRYTLWALYVQDNESGETLLTNQ